MLRFDPETFYDEEGLRAAGLDGQALARAVRAGELRCRRVGRLRLFRGDWLNEWLGRPDRPGLWTDADERRSHG
jgi:hypothetical protein